MTTESKPLRIGNCSGFYGDRLRRRARDARRRSARRAHRRLPGRADDDDPLEVARSDPAKGYAARSCADGGGARRLRRRRVKVVTERRRPEPRRPAPRAAGRRARSGLEGRRSPTSKATICSRSSRAAPPGDETFGTSTPAGRSPTARRSLTANAYLGGCGHRRRAGRRGRRRRRPGRVTDAVARRRPGGLALRLARDDWDSTARRRGRRRARARVRHAVHGRQLRLLRGGARRSSDRLPAGRECTPTARRSSPSTPARAGWSRSGP